MPDSASDSGSPLKTEAKLARPPWKHTGATGVRSSAFNLTLRAVLGLQLLIAVSLLPAGTAQARWDRVKAYLQPTAEIVQESDERIVLRSGSGAAAVELVLTVNWSPDSDIYGDIAFRRGGNPYRIWVVSERLAADESRPKPLWGRVLRADFLRLLRPPRSEQGAR